MLVRLGTGVGVGHCPHREHGNLPADGREVGAGVACCPRCEVVEVGVGGEGILAGVDAEDDGAGDDTDPAGTAAPDPTEAVGPESSDAPAPDPSEHAAPDPTPSSPGRRPTPKTYSRRRWVDPKAASSRQPPADESPTPDGDTAAASEPAPDRSSEADTERTTLRITRDVGEIFNVDEREYDLASEDVVTLPTPNAEQLLDRDAAERLD